jgi:DEAD/DEAH box helicase domain-containing protein
MLSRPRRGEWRLVHHEKIPARDAILKEIPSQLDQRVRGLIVASGIEELYSHQAEAIQLSLQGRNVVLATSTASGKTLAYHASVLHTLVRDPEATALFLFPLKALERDQRDAFLALAAARGISAAVYDGDTPESERRKIRSRPPRVLITNPDMLHVGFLAYHDAWREFFAHLAHVVLDEVHTYKGIFGSHISQVILRTKRVCALYGSRPQFFASSATVANPGEFLSRLIGDEIGVVDQTGAPSSERHFLFLQPELSPYTVTSRLFIAALKLGLKTIVFTRARKITELITTWVLGEAPFLKNRISSYRAGFLPEERREIEANLFSGKMDGVISTSALEMGIDVGGLDLCILVGYPGTIINTWQRGGRVGRAGRSSAIVLIAGNDALDQYFLKNPHDFFRRGCEDAVVDPLNREVLKRHLPCAAAETPLQQHEEFVASPDVQEVLQDLEQSGALYKVEEDGSWHSSRKRPQREVDLRSVGPAFSIFLEDGKTLIGISSGGRIFSECHEGAVYLHRASQYLITRLDLERRNVLAKPARLNYYTRALSEKDTDILGAPLASREFPGFIVREGRLKVTERTIGYEKRRTAGQDLIGVVELDLPPMHFETVGFWIEIPDRVKERVQDAGLHFMGGIHAMEHAAIAMFPLFALCDRDDIGGISTPQHEQVCRAAVFIYDGHPGGVGLAHHIFGRVEELLQKTKTLVEACPCEDGCPSCIHSPKCGSGNKPLDKKACLQVLTYLLEPERLDEKPAPPKAKRRFLIFPELGGGSDALAPRAKSSPETSPALSVVPARELSLNLVDKLKRDAGQPRRESATAPPPSEKTSPEPPRPSRIIRPEKIVVFDLETQRLADEVGGWSRVSRMGLALGVAHSEETGFVTFTEETVGDLVALLKDADLIVGFNQMRFDYEVLSAYTDVDLRARPNLDILREIYRVLGFRLKLNELAETTLGRTKLSDGLQAVKWFREGRHDLLEEYCREDVTITRELFHFGSEKGYLLFRNKKGKTARIPINWRNALGKT